MGQSDTLIRVDMGTEWLERLISVIVGVVVAIVAVIVIAALGAALAAVASVVIPALTASASIGLGSVIVAAGAGVVSGVYVYNTQFPEDLMLPVYSLSPEEIFRGQILLFDIDFFNPVTEIKVHTDIVDENGNRTGDGNVYSLNDYNTDQELNEALADNEQIRDYFYVEDGEEIITSKQNTALDLQVLVSQWYSAIRNIAIVLAMSVLLYIGIRMMLSTVAQDKAKYKQMLMDWLISICLLFFMHYIMSFSISIVNELTKVLTISNTDDGTGYVAVLELDDDGKLKEAVENLGMSDAIQDDKVMWPTNLMGQLRIQAQMSYGDASFIGYGLCFFVLVLLTIFYIFTYLRRVLYMAFLTMVAPLVALTYPIDKISDGQAQAFNKWLKEYIFNLLIQPLHLLIYTILVTSAFDLAGKNPIYSIVAIAFMIPAEKLMRSFFGFEKASTPGNLAAAAVGGGIANQALQKLLSKAPPGHKGIPEKGGNDSNESSSNIRTGFTGSEPSAIDSVAEDIRTNGGAEGTLPEGESPQGTGGPSVADALPLNEDPVRRAEREALEERIADGQISEDELTDEQRQMLGIRMANNQDEFNNNNEGTNNNTTGNNTIQVRRISGRTGNIKGAVMEGGKSLGKEAKKNIWKGVKKLPRAAGAIAGAGVAGAFGLGMGIATGDPKNVATWTGAAVLGGGKLGTVTIGDLKGNSINTGQRSATREAMEKAYFGDDYAKHVSERNQKAWKKNSENREALEKLLGQKQAKELYESGTIDNYLKNDISDPKLIAAMEKAMAEEQGQGGNVSFNDMLLASEAREVYGNGKSRLGGKAREELGKDYASQFEKRGISADKAQKSADKIADRVDAINRIYSKL